MMRRKSRRRGEHRADSDDMISDLPDSILGNILSRLPTTKNAVSTGILSRRWKFLWTTIGNLHFSYIASSFSGSVEQFVKSVNYVTLLHKPAAYFNKFSLTWYSDCIPFYINTWISAAVARDVHELSIHLGAYKLPIHVQSYLFTHEKLKSLELMNCNICFSPEIVVSLPRLETLKLSSVSFQSAEAFTKLVDGCPVLNYLVLVIDFSNMVQVQVVAPFKCKISSTCLKHLDLSASASGVSSSALWGLELDAPSLNYINLCRIHSFVIVQEERLNFLCEADIYLVPFEQENRVPNYLNSFVETIQALSYAKRLDLSKEAVRVLSCATIKMQTGFKRLKRLVVHIGQNHWSSVQNLIELSDNLENLTVTKDADYYGEEGHSNWTNPSVVPTCLSNSLKIVVIGAYDGHTDEQAMVEYISKHGSVLRTMEIRFGRTYSRFNTKYKLVQLISTSKKSTTCEVNFLDYPRYNYP